MILSSFKISATNGAYLCGEVRVVDASARRPVVVICHGFKGFKDWGSFPYIAERVAEAGFAALTFNFSHNGIGEGITEYQEIERFKANSLSLEQADLHLLLEKLNSGELFAAAEPNQDLTRCLDASRIALVGHSRAGASIIPVGAEVQAVRAVVALAAIATLPPVSPEEEAEWRERGYKIVQNKRTGQELPLGLPLLEDLLNRRTMIEQAARELRKPLLIIHGDADEAVPHTHAEKLASWAPQATLEILPGAGHTFGAVHPFKGTTPDLDRALELMCEFLEVELGA